MRKFFLKSVFLMMILTLLSACTLPLTQATPPSVSDEEMATRVAKILTEMPQEEATAGLPTAELPPIYTQTASPTQETMATATATEAATIEVVQTAEVQPSATQQPSSTSIVVPTVQVTTAPAFTPPADDPATKLGSPSWTDDMEDDTYWPTGYDKYTAIAFKDGKLKLTGLTTTDGWRLASTEHLTNAYIEASITTGTCTGSDRYGLMFHVPVSSDANKGYLLGVTCDGKYDLREWDATIGSNGSMTTHISWTESSAIQIGSNKTNRVGIMTVDDQLIIYINGVKVNEVKDDSFSSGSFGLFIGAKETTDFTISVDEISYWKNPTP